MAENSKIEWCDHTANFWRGCTKVSAGCKHCYAETLSGRNPGTLGVWGPKGRRIVASEAYWRHPLRWNREAAEAGVRRKVFCASLADVFEGRETMPEQDWDAVDAARERLWALIEATPWLDWLLLTKRPENVSRLVPPSWMFAGFPANVWLGTSVEDQAAANERIHRLALLPARVRFLSCEPLLGPVSLMQWLPVQYAQVYTTNMESTGPNLLPVGGAWYERTEWRTDQWGPEPGCPIHWIIVGGESGPGARPMHPDWARGLRDQCQVAGVPFFFKQWGEWLPGTEKRADGTDAQLHQAALEAFGGKADLRHEWADGSRSHRTGKKAAGRWLDGRNWDEMPLTPKEGMR